MFFEGQLETCSVLKQHMQVKVVLAFPSGVVQCQNIF